MFGLGVTGFNVFILPFIKSSKHFTNVYSKLKEFENVYLLLREPIFILIFQPLASGSTFVF